MSPSNRSVRTCRLVCGSGPLNPRSVESNPRCRVDLGDQILPGCTWARCACEETTFQVLKLFGVGVTEVRLHRKKASSIQSACHGRYADRK